MFFNCFQIKLRWNLICSIITTVLLAAILNTGMCIANGALRVNPWSPLHDPLSPKASVFARELRRDKTAWSSACREGRYYAEADNAIISSGINAGSPAKADEKKPPFAPGEKLVFELNWTLITAGEATLTVMPIMKIKGQDVYHFVMKARTNNFLDHIYKVRDRIDSYTDLNMNHAVFYTQKQREGSYKKKARVKFDWDQNQAQYTNLTKQKKKSPIDVMPGTFDPLSVFYYARTIPFEVGQTIRRPVTDGKKCVMGRARIVRREKITVQAGTFDTFLIVPELKHIGGVFKKSPDAKIELWVTADERRLPIRLKSEVVVGSFYGELVSYTK